MIHGVLRWVYENLTLLVVLAVLGVFIAIPLNRMPENITRNKVSQVRGDFRTLEAALATYHTDHSAFPASPDSLRKPNGARPARIDPFGRKKDTPYRYVTWTNEGDWWLLVSLGPDKKPQYPPDLILPSDPARLKGWTYDPTNGTESPGDIFRYGGVPSATVPPEEP